MERTKTDKGVADESTKIQKSIHIQIEVENLYNNKSKTLLTHFVTKFNYLVLQQLFALTTTTLILSLYDK